VAYFFWPPCIVRTSACSSMSSSVRLVATFMLHILIRIIIIIIICWVVPPSIIILIVMWPAISTTDADTYYLYDVTSGEWVAWVVWVFKTQRDFSPLRKWVCHNQLRQLHIPFFVIDGRHCVAIRIHACPNRCFMPTDTKSMFENTISRVFPIPNVFYVVLKWHDNNIILIYILSNDSTEKLGNNIR